MTAVSAGMERFLGTVVGLGLGVGLLWVACLPERRMKEVTLPRFWLPFLLRAWNRAPALLVRILLAASGVLFIALTVAALFTEA